MDVERLLQYRSERDEFFVTHYASPLPDEYKDDFKGLDYFAPDPSWVVTGPFESTSMGTITIEATDGAESAYSTVGEVVLALESEYRLVVLDDGDGGQFIPFRDATCGDTTYRGGRYVGATINEDGTATVDFNRASNPWCVFDDEFSCPLPPSANVLAEFVTAGEKLWVPPSVADPPPPESS
jgi:uncharacterized protein